jgi:hypothetical protein
MSIRPYQGRILGILQSDANLLVSDYLLRLLFTLRGVRG